jgi:hypothetical protein
MLGEVADAYDSVTTPSRRDMINRTIDAANAFATSTINDQELTALLSGWEAISDNQPGLLEDGPSGWWQLMNACHACCTEIVSGPGSREAAGWIFGAASGLPADLSVAEEPRLVRETLDEHIDEATPAGRLVGRLLSIVQRP